MDYSWSLNQLDTIATQILKRWQANPDSVKPLYPNGATDFNYITIRDIELIISLSSIGSATECVYISLKDCNGQVCKPFILSFFNRRKYNRALAKLKKVQEGLQYGGSKQELGDRLIYRAFPETFEPLLTPKK